MDDWSSVCFVIVSLLALITQIIVPTLRGPVSSLWADPKDWINEPILENSDSVGSIALSFILFLGLTCVLVVGIACLCLWSMTRGGTTKASFLQLITGKFLQATRCKVEFLWEDPIIVGITVAFNVKFYQRNGRPYPISNADGVLIEITQGIQKIALVREFGEKEAVNIALCKFTARKAGDYSICILVGNKHINGSPFLKTFLPGPPDPAHISLVHHCSTVVCISGKPHHILIEPRDTYHNICSFKDGEADIHNYQIVINESEVGCVVYPQSHIIYDPFNKRVSIRVTLLRPGCYRSKIQYIDQIISNGDFEIIVLTENEFSRVQKSIVKRSLEGSEARLLSLAGSTLIKPKKVYCYVSPKQLIIKEFIFKLIPKRVITFRLCPSTKFLFKGTHEPTGLPQLVIDDGCQPSTSLCMTDRNVIAATFTQFMLKNIGGSETFKDKQEHFYHELRRHHAKHQHRKLAFVVQRENLLESAMKVTRSFTPFSWCHNFEITFQGEEGLDWGGVRREWFELICAALFDPSERGLFAPLHEGAQALVHPNPNRDNLWNKKHYEFAGKIVGKCLYESALGGGYRLTVRARFTRAFLAQIIGLRVHYKHFSQDDPCLYSGKIIHLLKNQPESLDEPIYFTEEVMIDGQLKTVELVQGGSGIQVTSSNLQAYLDTLAQYRLSTRVSSEVFAFLAGLNEIVPDNLLSIFDENELELLMCGIDEYSISDFKANHTEESRVWGEFQRVLYWFWTAISNFNEEEMARLLQFTTGCSRLPPGGFGQLSPLFQISSSHTYGNLPTAHTCFNQLCLPDYESYEHFEKALLLAIKEGSEGFGLV